MLVHLFVSYRLQLMLIWINLIYILIIFHLFYVSIFDRTNFSSKVINFKINLFIN